jgi:hypothetical protein
MAVFERLIRNYFVDQGSPSKLETEVLDAIERLDATNPTLRVTAMD